MIDIKYKSGKYILTIDVGTQSVRVSLINRKGEIADIEKVKMQSYFSTRAGWAEQNIDYMWSVFAQGSRALLGRNEHLKSEIAAVSLTSQRGSIVVLDKDNKPLRPAIIWLDRRQAKLNSWASKFTAFKLWMVNMLSAANYAYKEAEINWIKQNEKEIWDKASKVSFISGYFNLKLSGEYKDSVANQVGYLPFDYKKHKWISSRFNVRRKMFDLDHSMLPELVDVGELIGYINKDASADTAIPEGVPLIASAADKAAEVLGSGVFDSSVACLSYGTTATVQLVSDKYSELIPYFPSYPSAIPKKYNIEVMVYRGFWMIDWFKNQFGGAEVKKARALDVEPESLLDALINDVPPGSMGLTLQPYWSAGVKSPGLEAKGAIIGFGDVHTRSHIYRAIIEGLAYALRKGLEDIEKKTGKKINSLRVSGGGSQSDAIMQITADIFGKKVERPHSYETSSVGAAIDAAIALGWYATYEEAVSEMTSVDKEFIPDMKTHKLYDDIYRKVYFKMYDRLKPLYKQIKSIFNYPDH